MVKESELGSHDLFKNLAGEDQHSNISNVLGAYSILAEKAQDIILFIKPNGDIIAVNDVGLQKYGYSREKLLAMNVMSLRTEEQFLVGFDLQTIKENGEFVETIHQRADGSLINVQVNSQFTKINGEEVILSIIRDITEQKSIEKQLQYVARHDYLTGLPNQYYLIEYISQLREKQNLKMSTLFLVNIDNFKIANDAYGYLKGDSILKQIVNCFNSNLRKNDFFARLGRDEFAIILSDISREEAKLLANRLLAELNKENFIPATSFCKITASIGVAFIETVADLDSAFAYAEAALRRAKKEGKNRAVIIQEMADKKKVAENNRILTIINSAIKKNNFKLFLQPIYKIGNEILHYEALIRMFDDQGGLILPGMFIPLAEKYGLMTYIDQWVIGRAIEMLASQADLSIFVNISGESLGCDAMLAWIESQIRKSKISPGRIGFEITETTAIKNITKTEKWIYELKALGCCFALDDFGLGFSSFSHLQKLPVDYLKIDGSFVRDLDSDNTKIALVQAMNAVAHTLGKKTIAEFVENESIWQILRELKVDYGQGYYLGMPTPICNL